MKKISFFFLLLFFFPSSVFAKNVKEEIFPIMDFENKLTSLIVSFTIPEGYHEKEILLKPDIFSVLKDFNIENKIRVTIQIKNRSSQTYHYVNQSFKIEKNLLQEENNYLFRTKNKALKSLISPTSSYCDSSLDTSLKKKGYSGIQSLDRYYLDFYNQKYHLKRTKIENFPEYIMKDLITSPKTSYLETNLSVEKSYEYYFYHHLLFLKFPKDQWTPIGKWQKSEGKDFFFHQSLKNIKAHSTKRMTGMYILLSEGFQKSYPATYFSLTFQFRLKV